MTYSISDIDQTTHLNDCRPQTAPCNWEEKLTNEFNKTTETEHTKSSDDESHPQDALPDALETMGEIGGRDCRLSFAAVKNLINAHAFAGSRGWDLNVMVTIRLDRAAGFRRLDWTPWQSRLLDKVSRWLIRQDIPVAFVWTKEAGRLHQSHCHLLLHLTDPVRQDRPLVEFIRRTGEFIDDEPGNRAVVVSAGSFGMKTAPMLSGALRYVLKTVDPKATRAGMNIAKNLGIKPYRNAQHITGRLHHISHSIGPSVRHEAGWKPIRDLQHLRAYLNP